MEPSPGKEGITVKKKLYRVNEGKVVAGVCGGLAEYLDIDPTVIRLIWALVGLSGAGVLAYFVAALVMPVKPLGIEE